MAWVLYCLATHPEAEAQLLQELRGADLPCNGDLDAALAVLSSSFDPLKELPFLAAVMAEAMRLYSAGASSSPRCVCVRARACVRVCVCVCVVECEHCTVLA
jgi:cytochrome P450